MRKAKTSIIASLLISLILAIGTIVPVHASPIYDGHSEHIHGPECNRYIPEELKNGFTMNITKNFLTSETTTTINTGSRIIDINAPNNRSINEFIQNSLMQTATVATTRQIILARSEMFQNTSNDATTRHTCNTLRQRVTSRTHYGPDASFCSTIVETYELYCISCNRITGVGANTIFGPSHNWVGTVNGSNISFTCSNCGRRS